MENVNKEIKNKIDLINEKILNGEENPDIFVFDGKEYVIETEQRGDIDEIYEFSEIKDGSKFLYKTYDELFDYFYQEWIDEEQDKGVQQNKI